MKKLKSTKIKLIAKGMALIATTRIYNFVSRDEILLMLYIYKTQFSL